MPTYLSGVTMMLEQSLAALAFRVGPFSDGVALPFWLGKSNEWCLEHVGSVDWER